MRLPTVALSWLCLLGLSAAPAWGAERAEDCALESMRCEPVADGFDARLEAVLPPGRREAVLIEVIDEAGGVHRRTLQGAGRQVLTLRLPAPASTATIDPDEEVADPDRYNNHWPRRIVVTPWPEAPTDAYYLRYYPGVTFKQGQAPVRPRGAPMMPPAQGPMGLGVGLEGRLRGEHGWQVLANMGASPFAPSLTPQFSLHGYWLPHPNWGVDGDVGFNMAGALTSELGTSLILWDGAGPATDLPVLAHQLRAAVGHQAPTFPGQVNYDYGQLTLFRDDTASIGLASNASFLVGLDGAWRASVDGQRAFGLADWLSLRANASAGLCDARLPLQNRLGAGLLSQEWLPVERRVNGRLSLLTPLARGLAVPLGPVATLAQVEGNLFVEGAWVQDPARPGPLAGVGAELVLLQDTMFGFPLTLNVGYALPVTGGPGRFYVTTTDPFFPRVPPGAAPAP